MNADLDPHSLDLASDELCTKVFNANISKTSRKIYKISSSNQKCTRDACLAQISSALTEDGLYYGTMARISATKRSPWKWTLTPEKLTKMLAIGIDAAAKTIEATTQRVSRDPVRPLHRRYRTKQMAFRYNYLDTVCYTDTIFVNKKSRLGHKCGQLYVLEKDFLKFYPLRTESDSHSTLLNLFSEIRISRRIHCDNRKTMKSEKWKKTIRDVQSTQSWTEPYSPFQNRGEGRIKICKNKIKRLMKEYAIPVRLWDFVALYVSDTHNLTASALTENRPPKEFIEGNQQDISEYTQFTLYEPCYFYDSAESFPDQNEKLGRWLGVSHRVGQGMCFWILKSSAPSIGQKRKKSVGHSRFNAPRPP